MLTRNSNSKLPFSYPTKDTKREGQDSFLPLKMVDNTLSKYSNLQLGYQRTQLLLVGVAAEITEFLHLIFGIFRCLYVYNNWRKLKRIAMKSFQISFDCMYDD